MARSEGETWEIGDESGYLSGRAPAAASLPAVARHTACGTSRDHSSLVLLEERMLRRFALVTLTAFAALALPRAGSAQEIAVPAPAQQAVTTPATGPSIDAATVGVRAEQNVQIPVKGTVVAQARRGTNDATALMIVGGAAFLAGAVIGGDAGTIIMIGGAGVGLYGLYLYLQ